MEEALERLRQACLEEMPWLRPINVNRVAHDKHLQCYWFPLLFNPRQSLEESTGLHGRVNWKTGEVVLPLREGRELFRRYVMDCLQVTSHREFYYKSREILDPLQIHPFVHEALHYCITRYPPQRLFSLKSPSLNQHNNYVRSNILKLDPLMFELMTKDKLTFGKYERELSKDARVIIEGLARLYAYETRIKPEITKRKRQKMKKREKLLTDYEVESAANLYLTTIRELYESYSTKTQHLPTPQQVDKGIATLLNFDDPLWPPVVQVSDPDFQRRVIRRLLIFAYWSFIESLRVPL